MRMIQPGGEHLRRDGAAIGRTQLFQGESSRDQGKGEQHTLQDAEKFKVKC